MRIARASLVVLVCACGRIGFDRSIDADADARDIDAVLPAACPSDPRLLACWDYEGDVLDRTQRGNDGTPRAITFEPGIDGLAVTTGATSRIDLLAPNLSTSGAVTLDVWIRPTAIDALQIVIDHNAHWAVLVRPGGVISCNNVGTNALYSSGSIPPQVWTHVGCSYDGSVMTLTINGVIDATGPVAPFDPDQDAAAIAGNAPETDALVPYDGALDRLRIWSSALTVTELCTFGAGC